MVAPPHLLDTVLDDLALHQARICYYHRSYITHINRFEALDHRHATAPAAEAQAAQCDAILAQLGSHLKKHQEIIVFAQNNLPSIVTMLSSTAQYRDQPQDQVQHLVQDCVARFTAWGARVEKLYGVEAKDIREDVQRELGELVDGIRGYRDAMLRWRKRVEARRQREESGRVFG